MAHRAAPIEHRARYVYDEEPLGVFGYERVVPERDEERPYEPVVMPVTPQYAVEDAQLYDLEESHGPEVRFGAPSEMETYE